MRGRPLPILHQTLATRQVHSGCDFQDYQRHPLRYGGLKNRKSLFIFNPTYLVPENVKVLWASSQCGPSGDDAQREPDHTRKHRQVLWTAQCFNSPSRGRGGSSLLWVRTGEQLFFLKREEVPFVLASPHTFKVMKGFWVTLWFFSEISLSYWLKSYKPLLMPYSQTWRKESNYQLTRLWALDEQFFNLGRERRRRHKESTEELGSILIIFGRGSTCFSMILILGVQTQIS